MILQVAPPISQDRRGEPAFSPLSRYISGSHMGATCNMPWEKAKWPYSFKKTKDVIQTTQNGPSQFPSPNILVNSEDLDFEVDVRGLDKSHGLLKNQGNCQIKKKKTKQNPETTGATKSTYPHSFDLGQEPHRHASLRGIAAVIIHGWTAKCCLQDLNDHRCCCCRGYWYLADSRHLIEETVFFQSKQLEAVSP